MSSDRRRGRLFCGTSGFSYPAWAPRFYETGTRPGALLPAYAARLNACELNNTFYQQPKPAAISGWLAATADDFRFSVKAQRGGSIHALFGGAAETVRWLTAPYRLFGERLGTVLFRVPDPIKRNDEQLAQLLAAWPRDLPLTMEFQDESWRDDEVHAQLMEAGTALCATDLDERDPPDLRVTAPFVYLRLRRQSYSETELAEWAARLEPFLDDGLDAFVFFRHDADGQSPLRAERLRALVASAAAANEPRKSERTP